MKNIVLIAVIFCLTVLAACYMETTDINAHGKQESKKEKTEHVQKKKENAKSNQSNELNIKNQKDLSEVIYSHKDEQTKMNAYNEAIDKGILPRSNNYQEAVYAYEESVWMKEESRSQ